MKWFGPLFFLFIMFANSYATYADLMLDSSINPKQVEKRVIPLFKSTVQPYGDRHSADFGGRYGKQGTFDHDEGKFAWIFNGARLYSTVGSFTPEIAPLPDCTPDSDELVPGSQCNWRRERFKVCYLFMFNGENLKLESVARLNIARDKGLLKGLPRCRSILAMSVAKSVPDAMLITLGYIDSAEPAEKNSEPKEFKTTLLLRFRDDNGHLKIEQDDGCLGNPNSYDTILTARKALAQCSKVKK